MKRLSFWACITLLFLFLACYSAPTDLFAEELSSIQLKKIEDAITKLKNPARGIQREGYKDIKYIGTSSIPYLITALMDKAVNFEAKMLFCNILGDFKTSDALSALTYTLKNESVAVRAAACEALGKIGDASAVESLIGMLSDADHPVRSAALNALINFDSPGIALAAGKLLTDANDTVRISAITLLDDKADPATVESIRKAFQDDKTPGVRMIAARALGKLKDINSIGVLMEAVTEDLSEGVRKEVVTALGKIGDKKAIPALIEGLKDDYKDVQIEASGALKKLTGEDFGRDPIAWAEWYKR